MSSLVEKEISMQTFLIEKIGVLRERPNLVVEELEAIKSTLKNTKIEAKTIGGIDKEIEKLKNYKSKNDIKFSEGLSRGAHKQIQNFLNLKDGDFTTFASTSAESLEPVLQTHLQSYGRVCQIFDTFSDENRFIQKVFMNSTQKGVNYRSFLFDSSLKHYGVSCLKYKNTFIVNIVFSNAIEELAIYNLDDEFAEKINELRTKDSKIYDHYTDEYKKILNSVPGFNADQIGKFFTLIGEKKKLQSLKKEPMLDDLAYQVLNHCSEKDDISLLNHKDGVYIPNQEQLESICNRFISRFNECESFIIQGETNNIFDLLEKTLFSGRKHDEGNDNLDIILKNDNFQNIGVVYEERPDKEGKKIAFVCCLFMDEFSHLPKKPYVKSIQEEFMRLRKDPKSYIKDLHDFAVKHKLRYGNDLPEVVERIRLSLRNFDSIPELIVDENLTKAAFEFIHFIRNEKNTHFYEEDDEELNTRIRHYLENPRQISELVMYAPFNPSEMVVSLLISEFTKDPLKPNHTNLLNRTFKYFGVAEKFVREKSLFCIIMTENNKPKMIHDKRFRDDLIDDLNNIRKYPKIFMKYVKLPNGEVYNPFMKITKTSSKEEILLDFLSSTRGFARLNQESKMDEACQKYLFEKINQNEEISENSKISSLLNKMTTDLNVTLKIESQDFLTKFLKPFGNGFNYIFNIAVNDHENISEKIHNDFGTEQRGNVDSKAFIIEIIMNKTFRDNLFSKNTKCFGICAHQERKLVFAIFTNDFVSERDVFDYTKTYQGKAPRPDLTEDEIDIIRKDFMRLDSAGTDILFPNLICKINEEHNLIGYNFIYYCALFKFKNEFPEAADKGIDMNKFVTIVREYMSLFTGKEWVSIFNILKEKTRSTLEQVQFMRLLSDVNFKFKEEESEELFKNICLPDLSLSQKNFVKIMDQMENNAEKVKRNNEYIGNSPINNSKSPQSTRNSFRNSTTKF